MCTLYFARIFFVVWVAQQLAHSLLERRIVGSNPSGGGCFLFTIAAGLWVHPTLISLRYLASSAGKVQRCVDVVLDVLFVYCTKWVFPLNPVKVQTRRTFLTLYFYNLVRVWLLKIFSSLTSMLN